MLSWVLRHRNQLRTLYGMPPEPALARLIEEQQRLDALEAAPAPLVERPTRGLPQVILEPRRPQD